MTHVLDLISKRPLLLLHLPNVYQQWAKNSSTDSDEQELLKKNFKSLSKDPRLRCRRYHLERDWKVLNWTMYQDF